MTLSASGTQWIILLTKKLRSCHPSAERQLDSLQEPYSVLGFIYAEDLTCFVCTQTAYTVCICVLASALQHRQQTLKKGQDKSLETITGKFLEKEKIPYFIFYEIKCMSMKYKLLSAQYVQQFLQKQLWFEKLPLSDTRHCCLCFCWWGSNWWVLFIHKPNCIA